MPAVRLPEAAMAPAERLWNTDRPWAALDRMIRAVGIEIVPHDQSLALLARRRPAVRQSSAPGRPRLRRR
jgi:hypothetical protein